MNEQDEYDWMVYVACMTFNHAPYIVDAMNGFTMQETNFPYVCAVVDDASTDGEQEIIKNYLNEHFDLKDNNVVRHEETKDYVLTFARHKTNLNCYFAVLYLKYNHYKKKSKAPYLTRWRNNSKYIAMCEGDDYWISPRKLQMQVDFLNNHHDYSMCFHGSAVKFESDIFSEARKHQFDGLETREYKGEELIRKWIIPTASIIFRSSIQLPTDSRFLVGDIVLRLQCSVVGRVFCFNDIMSVYRLNDGSVTSKPFPFNKNILHIEALIDHFPLYSSFYKQLLKRVIISTLFSRNFLKLIFFLLHNPRFLFKI